MASGGTDSTVRIWDIRRSAACLMALDQHNTETDPLSPTNQAHSGAVTGLCFHPTGHYLLSTAHDERLRLWDTWTGRNALVNYDPYICNQFDQPLAPLVVAAGGAGAGAAGCDPPLVFHPSDDRQILVFDMLKGKLVKRLRGSFGRVTCVCWRTDREELYSATNEREIIVWSPVFKDADVDQTPLVCREYTHMHSIHSWFSRREIF
ncbi:WD40-repeat-containing domain protein [Endogone sp. FLAS-F59071]|nr:WD40-repeat-containing domain protein [Endogone sp. FLAS-F59071]|eukprot:RUS14011.1 WD40-repeat-containing domain protein [Endogone sp. FLAS-F59071]